MALRLRIRGKLIVLFVMVGAQAALVIAAAL